MGAADFTRILEVLTAREIDFIVVGGVAAVLHGAPVTTFDLDVVHSRTNANIDKLLLALQDLGARYRSRPDLMPGKTHLSSPGHQLLSTVYGPLDLLGAIEEGRDYEALLPHSAMLRFRDSTIRVLDLQALVALKEASKDEKDQSKLPVLRRTLQEKRPSGKSD